jgi:ribosomal protein S8
MIDVQISIDTVAAERLIASLTAGDINFAVATGINETINRAQQAVRTKAYLDAFTQRNKSLAKAITAIPNAERANKRKLTVRMVNVRDGKTGRMAGEGFIERQIEGKTKRAKGSNIAIPVIGPGMRRGISGSIPTKQKPTKNPNLFRIKNRLVERQKNGKLVTRFVLTPTAKASSKGRFRYLEVGEKTIVDNISRIVTARIRSVIARNSLQSRGMGGRPRGGFFRGP